MNADDVGRTFLTLRVTGDFTPSTITERLHLAPDASWIAGDLRRNGTRLAVSGWVASSPEGLSDEIEEHLVWLLDRLEPASDALGEFRRDGIDVVADCFWESVGRGGGPWIPPEAMARLAALDIPLLVSFYALDD